MPPITVTLMQGLLALTYLYLVVQRPGNLRHLTAICFLLIATAVRCQIDVDAVTDFRSYYDSFLDLKYCRGRPVSLVEPYILVVYNLVILCIRADDLTQITSIYYLHFAIVTVLFLWLAYFPQVTFECKLVLFLTFYPWMAFAALRAGMAYAASCFFFTALPGTSLCIAQWTVPLFHMSTLPLLAAIKAKHLKPLAKLTLLTFCFMLTLSASLTTFHYFTHITTKLGYYAESSSERSSHSLLIFHIANIFLFLYFCLINPRFRSSGTVLMLMACYVIGYSVNPVVGVRLFPLVLIASMAENVSFANYRLPNLLVCSAYLPVFFSRFHQIVLWW